MTETVKKLAQLILTGGVDTLYTVPGATSALIKTISVVNIGGVAQSVKIWQSGSADDNVILPQIILASGEFANYGGVLTLAATDTIEAEGDTGITITMEGVEFS